MLIPLLINGDVHNLEIYMKLSRKNAKHLAMRQADYATMMATKNTQASGVQQRKDTGGFHKPGSNKK